MESYGPREKSYRGRAFLYVLLSSGPEDLLKVGMTQNPLQRWSSFHSRWFKAFDLDHSLLVETETRADAQALETSLHRSLALHQCPVPLTMFAGAGGGTEWYRGAYTAAHRFVIDCERQGYVIHRQAREWLVPVMCTELVRLDGIVREAFNRQCAGVLTSTQLDLVHALVESHLEFGADIEHMIPPEIRGELHLSV